MNLFHFTKWRSIFLKRFISFKMKIRFRVSNKQDKIRFWNVFHVWKIKKKVFEEFFIFTKWTNIFLKRFHFYKMKRHILVELVETHGCEAVDVFTNQTSAILNRFSFIQVKLHNFEVFSFLPNKMHFLEAFFICPRLPKIVQSVQSCPILNTVQINFQVVKKLLKICTNN